MTMLENLVFGNKKYSSLPATATKQERQAVLDEITEEVFEELSHEEISAHVREVYDATIKEYTENPHNLHIVDELIDFMSELPHNARVLDIGCGTGRDVLFMSVADKKFREGLMGRIKNGKATLEKFSVPTGTYRVVGVDSSIGMLCAAQKKQSLLIQSGQLKLGENPCFQFHDATENLSDLGKFDGIWSCAALFTHTPRGCIEGTLASVSSILKEGGVFYTTYTQGFADDKYDKLLLSSTGRIKYFSHPKPSEIAKVAAQYGLVLMSEQYGDMEDANGNIVKKDLFVSQMYWTL